MDELASWDLPSSLSVLEELVTRTDSRYREAVTPSVANLSHRPDIVSPFSFLPQVPADPRASSSYARVHADW